MEANQYLEKARDSILDEWRTRTLDADPNGKYLRKANLGPFTNPLGHTVTKEIEVIFDGILGQGDSSLIEAALDGIIRIKAVQGTSASEALSFLRIGREIFRRECTKGQVLDSATMTEIENTFEDILFRGFDIYMGCREQLWNIKMDELKRNNYPGFDESVSCSSKTVPVVELTASEGN
jgi:hypothetical protein